MNSGYRQVLEENAFAFREGDERALAIYYREFYPSLAHYANQWLQDKTTAEEIAAEALVKTWHKRTQLEGFGAIRAYLYTIVHRACIDRLENDQKRKLLHRNAQGAVVSYDTPFEQLLRAEVYRTIHSALQQLSPANRKVIMMHYLEGKSTGQIAEELRLHPSTVKTQKARGLKALKRIIEHPLCWTLYWGIKIFLSGL